MKIQDEEIAQQNHSKALLNVRQDSYCTIGLKENAIIFQVLKHFILKQTRFGVCIVHEPENKIIGLKI
jgi:hypothetical protein